MTLNIVEQNNEAMKKVQKKYTTIKRVNVCMYVFISLNTQCFDDVSKSGYSMFP